MALAPLFRMRTNQPSVGINPSTVAVSGVSGTVSVTMSAALASTFTTGQVTVTASVTLVLVANSGSTFRSIYNPTTASIYYGSTTATTTGTAYVPAAPGYFTMSGNSAALYALTATGSVTVSMISW